MLAAMATDKKQRLEARVTSDQKKMFMHAASLAGRTLTDFVIQALTDASKDIINENEIFRLSRKDTQAVMESLLNPAKPAKSMMAAKKLHDRMVDMKDD